MLSVRIMRGNFDGADQFFALDQRNPRQAVEAATAQITSDALDRIFARVCSEHINTGQCSRVPDSFASLNNGAGILSRSHWRGCLQAVTSSRESLDITNGTSYLLHVRFHRVFSPVIRFALNFQ